VVVDRWERSRDTNSCPGAFDPGVSSRLRKNAGTSSFPGVGFAREPGIQEHGPKKSMSWPVLMESGPGPVGPSRNDTGVFQHPASGLTIMRFHFGQDVRWCVMREGINVEVSATDRDDWQRFSRIATAHRNMSGGRGSFWRPPRLRHGGNYAPRRGLEALLNGAGNERHARRRGWPVVEHVVALTLTEPPGEARHWTGRAMAAATDVSLRSVQRILPSQDPAVAAKLRDVVGLCLDPPAHSLVLSVDEKSQIEALDRTQLPMKRGRAGTMTHDYTRHGTTTLFAAPGTVIGQCMARHRHQEFIRFLNRIEAAVPGGKLIHAILDNYAAHKHPKCALGWLGIHAGCFISHPPPARGPMRSRPSLPRSPADGCSAASFARWSTCRPRSTDTSANTAANLNPSSGPLIPTASSRRSIEGIKCWRQTTR
jgi:hypothetical protein